MFGIAGTGCSLVDHIYAGIDFSSGKMAGYLSRSPGDGGLEPGKLTFTDDFERFSGKACLDAIEEMTGGGGVHSVNLGGPGLVAMIHAAQILDPAGFSFRFVGTLGEDAVADELLGLLGRTPLGTGGFLRKPGLTPFTYVLSDPGHDGGHGERSFLNNIGTAGNLAPDDLGDGFFEADMAVFGGTALVPRVHDALDGLLAKAKDRGAFTVVNTVYDFRAQRRNPRGRWPLGADDASYGHIDLLVADREEAFRLSGAGSVDRAMDFFVAKGVGAAVITDGIRDIVVDSSSTRYAPPGRTRLPVSMAIVRELEAHPERKGDTTGCGDNFAGGMIASVAGQLESGAATIDLTEAAAWGAASGGFACFGMGGVFRESRRGEKRALLEPYVREYLRELGA